MSSNYAQLDQLATVLTNKSGGSISASDRMALANMALDKMGNDTDLFESRRKALLSPALFTGVYEYYMVTDLKGEAIIDIRPVAPRSYMYEKKPPRAFDFEVRSGNGLPDFAVENNGATKILRINSAETPQYTNIHDCNSVDDNGTWIADTAGSDATNIYANTQNFMAGSGSISFDIDVSQSGNDYAQIYIDDMASVDLTDYQKVGSIFANVYIPDVTYVSTLTFRFGSATGDYYEFTVSTRHDGGSFQNGNNLVRMDFSDATEVGSPSITTIDYILFRISYSSSQTDMTGVLLDHVVARLGKFHEIVYYSSNLVLNTSGVQQRKFTSDDDTTVLDSEAEQMFISLYRHYLAVARRQEKLDNLPTDYLQSRAEYQLKYPSERALLGYEYDRIVDPNAPESLPRFI